MSATDDLLDELRALPGVAEAPGDMAGERSFRVRGREFLHVHGTSLLHIGLTREQKAAAVARGDARPHPYAPRSGAVELRLTGPEGLPAARRLAALAFERAAALAARFPPSPDPARA
jgi:hypothetical protein